MPCPRLLAACGLVLALACRPGSSPRDGISLDTRADSVNTPPIADVLERHTPALLEIPGVVGTGEGRRDERPTVVVFVTRRTTDVVRKVPRRLEGYVVEVRESGAVSAPPSD